MRQMTLTPGGAAELFHHVVPVCLQQVLSMDETMAVDPLAGTGVCY